MIAAIVLGALAAGGGYEVARRARLALGWRVAVSGLAGGVVGEVARRALSSSPSAAARAAPAAVEHPPSPKELTGAAFEVVRGGQYVAGVTLHGAVSGLATEARVRDQAERLGFVAVTVTRARPSWYPPTAPGADYYVQGVRSRPTETVQRHHEAGWLLGSIDIVAAYRVPRTLLPSSVA